MPNQTLGNRHVIIADDYMSSNNHFDWKLQHSDATTGARAGELRTPHGAITTPVFMPVGTQAAVKTLTSAEVTDLGAQIILGNT